MRLTRGFSYGPAVLGLFWTLFPLGACTEDRYLCGPGTHADGDWCVPNPTGGTGDATDSGTTDSGSDSASDSGDSGDSADSGDSGDSGDTADSATPDPARLVINEFMSSNDTKATDETGDFDDWIEIYNAGGESASLADCSLTDDSEQLSLYVFPADAALGPGEWMVVWTDGTPEEGAFHAIFTLTSAGDRAFLIRDPAGAAEVLDAVEFTEMATDVAAARIPDGASKWFTTENVSPGSANTK